MTIYKELEDYKIIMPLIEKLCKKLQEPFDLQFIESVFENSKGGLVIYGGFDNDNVVAIFGAWKDYDAMSGVNVLAEQFWYCLPEYSGAGVRLLKHIEKIYKGYIIEVGTSSFKLQQLLQRMGYRFHRILMRKGN